MASRLFGFLTRYHRYAFKSLPYNVYNVNSPRQNPEAVLASLANYNSHLQNQRLKVILREITTYQS